MLILSFCLIVSCVLSLEFQLTFHNAPIPIPDDLIRNAVCAVVSQSNCNTVQRITDGILIKTENVKMTEFVVMPNNMLDMVNDYLQNNSFNPYSDKSGLVQIVTMYDYTLVACIVPPIYIISISLITFLWVQKGCSFSCC